MSNLTKVDHMATMHSGIAKLAIIISVLGVMVVALVVAVVMGYAYVGAKDPGQTVALRSGACTVSDIEKYNGFVSKMEVGDEFNTFAADMKKRAGVDSDPNCLYILAQHQLKLGEKDVAREYVDKLAALSKKGLYADGRFNDLAGLNVLFASVRATDDNVDQAQLGEG